MKNKKEIIFLQIAAIFSILKVLKFGIANHSYVWEEFSMYQIVRDNEFYSVDLFANKFVPVAGPLLQYIFQYFYDIPFFHLLIGFAGWFFICYLLLQISHKYTNNYLATFICCASMMLLLPPPFSFNILPIASNGLFLSFRDWSTIMCLSSILLLLNGRRIMLVILLGINFFIHPTNTINVFIFIFLADLILGLKTKTNYIRELYPYLLFVLPVIIKVFLIQSIDFEFEPIAFDLHWQNVMLNEPDDISTLFFITNSIFRKKVIKYLFIILLALFLIKIDNKKIISRELSIAMTTIILVPVLTICLALYEKNIYEFFPDFLNDFIMPLELRRSWGIIPIFCLPIISRNGLSYLRKINIFDKLLIKTNMGIILLFLLILTFGIKPWKMSFNYNINGIKNLWDFNRKNPLYFYQINNEDFYFFGKDDAALNNDKRIEINSYYDICNFIKMKTEKGASFIHPPYIKTFRYHANRQGFASEKNDGNYAGLNRKYASRYYRQIEILTGVVYRNLEEPMYEGGKNYALLRNGYLSLKKTDIIKICKLFPNYNYFLTEVQHLLKFPVLYKNDSFIIYDLKIDK